METKKSIRREIKYLIDNLSEKDQIHFSRILSEKIRTTSIWQKCDLVLAFYPFSGEIDLLSLLREGLKEKTIALPLIEGKSMHFYPVEDLNLSHMKLNKWGIPEPEKKGNPIIPSDFLNPLMLVPGLAFTTNGKRLGRGGGYYDRYLEGDTKLTLMGTAYPFQIREDIPLESHDKLLHGVFF